MLLRLAPPCLWLLALLLAVPAHAQSVPSLVNYQGRLCNPDGTALATADYQLTFNLYDADTNGALVWGPQVFDSQTAQGHGPRIPVVQGYFNVMLGPVDTNGVSLASAFSGTNRFIEVTVTNHLPILPRQQILTAPFAFQAANSATLAGYDWSAVFGTNDPVNGKLPGARLVNGSVTAVQIASGAITSNQIAGGAITGTNLANSTVTAQQVALGTITASQIAPNTITSNQIVAGSVSSASLAPGAVLTPNIADGQVTLPKLAPRPSISISASTNPAPVGSIAISPDCGTPSFSGAGGTVFDVPNLSVTLVTTGRPVFVGLNPSTNGVTTVSGVWANDSGNPYLDLLFVRGTNVVAVLEP